MFLQIDLHPSERNCIRFPWLKNINGQVNGTNVSCYRFKRVLFALISSLFLLSDTLNYHLENLQSKIALEITENLYVDNVIILTEGTKEALKKYKEMKSIFNNASMNPMNKSENRTEQK